MLANNFLASRYMSHVTGKAALYILFSSYFRFDWLTKSLYTSVEKWKYFLQVGIELTTAYNQTRWSQEMF